MITLDLLTSHRETVERFWDRNSSHLWVQDLDAEDRDLLHTYFGSDVLPSEWTTIVQKPDYLRVKALINDAWNAKWHSSVKAKPSQTYLYAQKNLAAAQEESVSDIVGTKGEQALDRYLLGIFGG